METYPCSSSVLNKGTVNQKASWLPLDLKDPSLSAAFSLQFEATGVKQAGLWAVSPVKR